LCLLFNIHRGKAKPKKPTAFNPYVKPVKRSPREVIGALISAWVGEEK